MQNIGPLTPDEIENKLKEKLETLSSKKVEENTKNLAKEINIDYVNLVGFPITPEALRLIPEEKAREINIVCFWVDEREAKLATNLTETSQIEKFRQSFEQEQRLKTHLYLVSEDSLNYAFSLYQTLPKLYKPSKNVQITADDLERFQDEIKTFKDLNQAIKNVSISDLIALIIASALKSRASDIHIEAEEKDIKVRFRIDGVLVDTAEISKSLWENVISRIKLLAALKINIADRPQDGRFSIILPDDKIDVRVSCLPTSFGESVVMRLLRSSSAGFKFEDLGLRGKTFEILSREIKRPNGMIITTGPTGSGKTTTLYAILNKINKPGIKILTLEDPIEYQLPGINQSQVNRAKGYTFAKGLRSLMRQDPDVIMVGEIRDEETAQMAVQAALTGHLVISTLHTNNAAGAIPRFLSLKVKPFLLAPALNVVIAQRLVRRICPKCKQEIELPPQLLERVSADLSKVPEMKERLNKDLKFYQGQGCDYCQGLGYYGRIGIYEVLEINPEMEKLINQKDVSEYDIKKLAEEQGMTNMVIDGLLKAVDGITTVEEVYRVAE